MLKGESDVSSNGSRLLVTVDDGDNYVTFHELNVRKKIKTIAKRSWTVQVTVSFTARFKPHRGLVFFSFVGELA